MKVIIKIIEDCDSCEHLQYLDNALFCSELQEEIDEYPYGTFPKECPLNNLGEIETSLHITRKKAKP